MPLLKCEFLPAYMNQSISSFEGWQDCSDSRCLGDVWHSTTELEEIWSNDEFETIKSGKHCPTDDGGSEQSPQIYQNGFIVLSYAE